MSAFLDGVTGSLRSLSAAQKSAKGAPIYSLLINRPLGRVFAAIAHQFRLTPNTVTAISAVVTYAGIILIAAARPGWGAGLLISALLVIGYALDSADGQLARLRGGGSLLGEWLDHVIDAVKVVAIHLAVLVMAYRTDHSSSWLLVPILFAIVNSLHFSGMLLTDLLERVRGRSRPGADGAPSRLNSLVKLPTDYGVLCWVFVLLGAPSLFWGVYTFMAACTTLYTGLVLFRWARRVRALDAPTVPISGGVVANV